MLQLKTLFSHHRRVLLGALLTGSALLGPMGALAQQPPPTPVQLEPQIHEVRDFKLRSGATLDSMKVQYATLGTPKKDADGQIVNAVLNLHGWSGDYSQTATIAKDLIGAGKLLDPDKYFIVFVTALGSPGSSAPSTSGLGAKFPVYAIADMVSAQHELVTKKLGIKHLAGVTGVSMGGYQTLQWLTQYPDMMDWAVVIAASPKADGRNLGVFGIMSYTIRTDPAYRDGFYTEQPKEAMRRAFMSTYLWYFGAPFYDAQYKTEEQALKGLENAGLGSDKMDANDIIWRNKAMASYDVSKDLSKVKAKVLVIGVHEDELFPPDEAIRPIGYGIAGAKVFFYSSPLGHIGAATQLARAEPAITAFMKDTAAAKP